MKKLLLFLTIFTVSLVNARGGDVDNDFVGGVPNPNANGQDIYTNKKIPQGYETYELEPDKNGNCPSDYQLIPAKCVLK